MGSCIFQMPIKYLLQKENSNEDKMQHLRKTL